MLCCRLYVCCGLHAELIELIAPSICAHVCFRPINTHLYRCICMHTVCAGPLVSRLSKNAFEGPLISSLGNLKSLRTLLVSNNKLTSSLPSELGLLTALDRLCVAQKPA